MHPLLQAFVAVASYKPAHYKCRLAFFTFISVSFSYYKLQMYICIYVTLLAILPFALLRFLFAAFCFAFSFPISISKYVCMCMFNLVFTFLFILIIQLCFKMSPYLHSLFSQTNIKYYFYPLFTSFVTFSSCFGCLLLHLLCCCRKLL